MGFVTFQVPVTGVWTITGILDEQQATATAEITSDGQAVSAALTFDLAELTVTAPAGAQLTLTNGDRVLTHKSSGTDTFTLTRMGTWTITGTQDGLVLTTAEITAVPGGVYTAQLTIPTAVLTVSAPAGTSVRVTGDRFDETQAAVSGTAVFSLTALGRYTVSGTLDDLLAQPVTLDVTAFAPYQAALQIDAATITVTTVPDAQVQAVCGEQRLSGTAASGICVLKTQTFGTWQLSAALDGYTIQPQQVTVQAYQDYPVSLTARSATLIVTAPAGMRITIASGAYTDSQTAADGTASFQLFALGSYTVAGELDGLTAAPQTVQISAFDQTFRAALSLWVATITVTTETGTQVTAHNGDLQLTQTAAQGTAIFRVQKTGVWTVSATFDGQKATQTVSVTEQTDYPVTLRLPALLVQVDVGSSITCTHGQTVLTKTAQQEETCFYLPAHGVWTVRATLNGQSSNTATVSVTADQAYPVILAYAFATVTVMTEAGLTVTAQNGSMQLTQVAADGAARFEITQMGSWTFFAVKGDKTVSETISITEPTAYTVVLKFAGKLVYHGKLTVLSIRRGFASSGVVGNYAIFAGGANGDGSTDYTDAYDAALTRTKPDKCSLKSGYRPGAVAGGHLIAPRDKLIETYDTSLTHSTVDAVLMEKAGAYSAAAEVGSYALFAGGQQSSTVYLDTVYAFNQSLTVSAARALSAACIYLASAMVGRFALFAGGYERVSGTGQNLATVNAYNQSLTRTNPASLSMARYHLAGASSAAYALFAGGYRSATDNVEAGVVDVVDAYNTSLTRTVITPLSTARRSPAAATLGDYMIVGGGYIKSATAVTDAYDASLTRVTAPDLAAKAYWANAETIGNYAIFAGGFTSGYSQITTVCAYTLE